MKKKAQSQIITTVLLIVISLAAAILLWMIVKKFIEPQMFNARGDCMKVDLQFVDNTVRCNITESGGIVGGNFRRKEDEVGNISVTIVVDGQVFEKSDAGIPKYPGPLETGHFSVPSSFSEGQEIEVEVAAVVGKNLDAICDVSDKITITCVA